MIDFLKKRWVYHSLIWIIAYVAMALMIYINLGDSEPYIECLKEPLILFIPVMIVTYLSFWAKGRLFDSRQYLLYVLAATLIVVLGVILYEYFEQFDEGSPNPRAMNISNFIFLQIFAVGLQYFKRGIINQGQIQELRAEKAITELNALKAQINPHFLFNTLNNIYGMNQVNPEIGSEMILELSDVMRYHLEFSKAMKVKLEDEIQLLNSYVKLEQLRLSETCDVQVDFSGSDASIMISPLLFLPFIENAFKHGTHPTKDCYVHISLKTHPGSILLTVKNSLIANRKVVKTHIGLQNTKRRLELLFLQKHDLKVTKTDNYHLVELSIEV